MIETNDKELNCQIWFIKRMEQDKTNGKYIMETGLIFHYNLFKIVQEKVMNNSLLNVVEPDLDNLTTFQPSS